jgi:hypothetical protein
VIVSIMQPAYLPWLGYFHRVSIADLHIVLDHVEIDRNSKTKFANRNKIRTSAGWSWLTVPLISKGKTGELQLNKVEIDNSSNWRRKHLTTIELNYAKAPFIDQHRHFLESIYARQWTQLSALVRETTDYLFTALAIDTPRMFSSDLGIQTHKDELILDLCRMVGATEYISGPLGRDYIREQMFEDAGVRVRYHAYKHPVYPQPHSGFEAYMSAIDLLLNCGPESASIIGADQESVRL